MKKKTAPPKAIRAWAVVDPYRPQLRVGLIGDAPLCSHKDWMRENMLGWDLIRVEIRPVIRKKKRAR